MVPAADHERDARVVEHVPQVHAPGIVREGAALARRPLQQVEAIPPYQARPQKRELGLTLSIIKERAQAIDSVELKIFQNMKNTLKDKHQAISISLVSLSQLTPSKKIREIRLRFMQLTKEFKGRIARKLEGRLNQLSGIEKRLHAVSPFSILDRGYSIVTNSKQEIIKKVDQAKPSEKLSVKLSDGKLSVEVSK